MRELKILTIKKTNLATKYIEFWVEEETVLKNVFDLEKCELTNEQYESWSYCCKIGWFYKKLAEANLEDYARDNGLTGLKVTFEFDSPNWELIEVSK